LEIKKRLTTFDSIKQKNDNNMTTLEKIHAQIQREQRRIEMLQNTPSNGDADWYDFVNAEVKTAKAKIADLQAFFDAEYIKQNS
jgi:hypothetical protein